jgi:hypothetical protein
MHNVHEEPKSGLMKLEYRVKEKTIWYVTRYCQHGDGEMSGHSITEEGRFDDPLQAHRAANALCRYDALSYGVQVDDPRIVFPEPLDLSTPRQGTPQNVMASGVMFDETNNAAA